MPHNELDDLMEFDHVVRVHADGTVTAAYDANDRRTWAPELQDYAGDPELLGQARSQGWSLMTGYTDQYGYNGPVMHSSEFIGGKMVRDILSTPGLYVALVLNDADGEPSGWAVAYQLDEE